MQIYQDTEKSFGITPELTTQGSKVSTLAQTLAGHEHYHRMIGTEGDAAIFDAALNVPARHVGVQDRPMAFTDIMAPHFSPAFTNEDLALLDRDPTAELTLDEVLSAPMPLRRDVGLTGPSPRFLQKLEGVLGITKPAHIRFFEARQPFDEFWSNRVDRVTTQGWRGEPLQDQALRRNFFRAIMTEEFGINELDDIPLDAPTGLLRAAYIASGIPEIDANLPLLFGYGTVPRSARALNRIGRNRIIQDEIATRLRNNINTHKGYLGSRVTVGDLDYLGTNGTTGPALGVFTRLGVRRLIPDIASQQQLSLTAKLRQRFADRTTGLLRAGALDILEDAADELVHLGFELSPSALEAISTVAELSGRGQK